jgi:hypothetical protein
LLQRTLGLIQSLAPVVGILYDEALINTISPPLWFDVYDLSTDAPQERVEHVSISLTPNRAHAISTFPYAENEGNLGLLFIYASLSRSLFLHAFGSLALFPRIVVRWVSRDCHAFGLIHSPTS